MKKRQKAFTLVEVLITIVILWMMMVVVFETFTTVSNLTRRIEGERQIQNEMLYTTQTMQTLADTYTIDYEMYDQDAMFASEWLTETLYLKNPDGNKISVYASGDCYGWSIESTEHINKIRRGGCVLAMNKNGKETALTDKHLVSISHLQFKVTPFASNDRILYTGTSLSAYEEKAYEHLQYPWFWLFMRIYHKRYGVRRPMNTKYVMHQYFSVTDTLQL